MSQEKILVVEDDVELNEIICNFLKKENYKVCNVFSGDEAIIMAKKETPDMILLDIMLPGVDGFEVCRDIRTYSIAPIMIISAKNSEMDKMLALGIGADDYIEKPFSLLELGARIKSHLRRYKTFSNSKAQTEMIEYGEIRIDTNSHNVTVCGEPVELTTREYELLLYFANNPSHVFSKEQLLNHVWGGSDFIDINTITVYVGRIREKLTQAGACYIKTVWGAGYKWEM